MAKPKGNTNRDRNGRFAGKAGGGGSKSKSRSRRITLKIKTGRGYFTQTMTVKKGQVRSTIKKTLHAQGVKSGKVRFGGVF